LGESNLGQLL
jgi:hypothetical protein